MAASQKKISIFYQNFSLKLFIKLLETFETDRFRRFREIVYTDFKNIVLRKTRSKFPPTFQLFRGVFTNVRVTLTIFVGST